MNKFFENSFWWIKSYFVRIKIPPEIINSKGTKILHVGDFPSYLFPYLKRIVRFSKPDIIIHTGDMVDNLKVSRIPEHIPKYLKKVLVILGILQNSTAKEIYIVPGNNDIPEYIIKSAPFARVLKEDSVIEIEGVKICLSHHKRLITQKAQYYFYGHGLTGETWKHEYNDLDKTCYFNAVHSPTLIALSDKRVHYFSKL